MTYHFDCPWCHIPNRLQGAKHGAWRFRIACEGCTRDIVVTFDGALTIGKSGGALGRSEDATVPFQISPVLI
jgi:hypothetical protein